MLSTPTPAVLKDTFSSVLSSQCMA
eukprot:SAG25_NODE_9832_length_356_cov_0.723735_1_plen_24_part_01